MNKREIGQACENSVCNSLKKRGYTIISRNYFTPYGEIDIIALKNGLICFVEVKARHENSLTSGIEAVNSQKKQRIIQSTETFLANCDEKYRQMQPRYDIADVVFTVSKSLRIKRISYYANAFDTSDIYTGF